MSEPRPLPELLSPAGSPAALDAAIEGGADAVYFGGSAFNARMQAQNFGGSALDDAVARCHTYGVKAYITLNTLVYSREQDDCLRAAEAAYRAGADALIVADLGVAALLRRQIPELALHASTQASGHNPEGARRLAELGFSRMVCARELSREDLRALMAESPIEIEMFIHGALCVSHSGQCLFSSLVGGRSGNRGECAQPCRLPYSVGGRESYPLSLRDLSLASYVPELIDLGVSSLKIEGRMKSPEYVRDVTAIWRRLLDERRGADADEMRRLADIFSRGGFTDAYYRGADLTRAREMLGVRSTADKAASRQLEPFRAITRTRPIALSAKIVSGEPVTLTASAGACSVTVSGDPPEPARTAPLDRAGVLRCLGKLGGTPYAAEQIDLTLGDGLIMPVSRLNALRRAVVGALSAELFPHTPHPDFSAVGYGEHPSAPTSPLPSARAARFHTEEQIPTSAREFFDRIYLPLEAYSPVADGVVIPAVVMPRERDAVRELLARAAGVGARHALVGNLGHLDMALEAGLIPHGDYRLNTVNDESLAALSGLGFSDCLLSPELTLPQIRDLRGGKAVIVYGRVPLMTLEKCAIRAVDGCAACAGNSAVLVDRRGVRFPMLREWEHRTLVLNSRPTYLLDREAALDAAGVTVKHYFFTVESREEADRVIEAAKKGKPPVGEVRRI